MQENNPGRAHALGARTLRLAEHLLESLFTAGSGGLARVVRIAWMAGLLVAGLYLWGIFFSWGNFSLDFLDWAEVTGPRYALLQDAMLKGQIPLHAANTTALRGVTDRYFSIADTPFSPQAVLLRFLSISRYIFIDTILFYLIGFLGLALIARKYRLSPVAFLLLFLLFNFNGYITGHFGVGHTIWTAYFLLPYFIFLVLELVERGQAGWRWVLGLSILMLAMLLQGGFHQYLWCLIFLGLLALFNLRLVKPVLLGGLFSILVSLPRLLPPSLALSGITQQYLGGFATVTDLVANLMAMRDPDRAAALPSNLFPLRWWELDFFIGLIGFALLVIFGILAPLRRERSRKSVSGQILLASLVMSALSIGQVFAIIVKVLPFPPLTGERVTSRMFSLPLVFLLALAVIWMQRWLDERPSGATGLPAWAQLVGLGLCGLVFHDLYQHLQAWRVRYLDGLVYLFPKVPFNPSQHTIASRPDPVYIAMLAGGSLVALVALAVLIGLSFRRKAAVL